MSELMELRPATETMTLTDGRGNTVHREVKLTLDVRDYEGTAGFPWVLVAANRHLSQEDITLYLERKAVQTPGVARTRSWVQRRAWMFRPRDSAERRGGPDTEQGRTTRTRDSTYGGSSKAIPYGTVSDAKGTWHQSGQRSFVGPIAVTECSKRLWGIPAVSC